MCCSLNHEPMSCGPGPMAIVRICNVHGYNRGSPTIIVVTIGAEKEAGGMMGSRGLNNKCLAARYRVQCCCCRMDVCHWVFDFTAHLSLFTSVVRGIGSPGYKKVLNSPLHLLLFSSSASFHTPNTAISSTHKAIPLLRNTYIVIMHPSSNMVPDTTNTNFAGTEHTLRFQQLNFDDLEMTDIAALAEIGQTLPSQLHNPIDFTMTDFAALAETGQALPPQRHDFIDPAKTDVAELAEVDAGCVGRVCSQGSISQAPSAQETSYLGQSYPTSQFI